MEKKSQMPFFVVVAFIAQTVCFFFFSYFLEIKLFYIFCVIFFLLISNRVYLDVICDFDRFEKSEREKESEKGESKHQRYMYEHEILCHGITINLRYVFFVYCAVHTQKKVVINRYDVFLCSMCAMWWWWWCRWWNSAHEYTSYVNTIISWIADNLLYTECDESNKYNKNCSFFFLVFTLQYLHRLNRYYSRLLLNRIVQNKVHC